MPTASPENASFSLVHQRGASVVLLTRQSDLQLSGSDNICDNANRLARVVQRTALFNMLIP